MRVKVLGNILPCLIRYCYRYDKKGKKYYFISYLCIPVLIFAFDCKVIIIWKNVRLNCVEGLVVRQAEWDPYICHTVHAKPRPQTTSVILQSGAVNVYLGVQRGQGELVLDQDKLIFFFLVKHYTFIIITNISGVISIVLFCAFLLSCFFFSFLSLFLLSFPEFY